MKNSQKPSCLQKGPPCIQTHSGPFLLIQFTAHSWLLYSSTLSSTLEGTQGDILLDKDGNELSLSQYVTSSADSVRVTIPILQYKDIKLNATLISGGGATSEDAEVTIEPSTLRVTGNTAVLDAMADELTIRTIDLAQITGTETFEVTPELPSGVTSRADSQTVKITVTLKGLVTKEFTVPTANILRKEAPAGISRHYDAAAKQVELEVALPANVSAGVIGGPYTVQVSLSETDGGNTES